MCEVILHQIQIHQQRGLAVTLTTIAVADGFAEGDKVVGWLAPSRSPTVATTLPQDVQEVVTEVGGAGALSYEG